MQHTSPAIGSLTKNVFEVSLIELHLQEMSSQFKSLYQLLRCEYSPKSVAGINRKPALGSIAIIAHFENRPYEINFKPTNIHEI